MPVVASPRLMFGAEYSSTRSSSLAPASYRCPYSISLKRKEVVRCFRGNSFASAQSVSQYGRTRTDAPPMFGNVPSPSKASHDEAIQTSLLQGEADWGRLELAHPRIRKPGGGGVPPLAPEPVRAINGEPQLFILVLVCATTDTPHKP